MTKGAGGSLRGGSLPIAHAIKEQFNVPCIAHFTCRDLTPQVRAKLVSGSDRCGWTVDEWNHPIDSAELVSAEQTIGQVHRP